jgi:hypothetical protein
MLVAYFVVSVLADVKRHTMSRTIALLAVTLLGVVAGSAAAASTPCGAGGLDLSSVPFSSFVFNASFEAQLPYPVLWTFSVCNVSGRVPPGKACIGAAPTFAAYIAIYGATKWCGNSWPGQTAPWAAAGNGTLTALFADPEGRNPTRLTVSCGTTLALAPEGSAPFRSTVAKGNKGQFTDIRLQTTAVCP